MKSFDVIIAGAGAAGLMAAISASNSGKKVLLLEKMKTPGRKLLITGKGRCNITNNAPLGEFITHIHPKGKFLRKVFTQYFTKDTIDFFEKSGVETKLERGGRYFPVSDKAADILNALQKGINNQRVELMCGSEVEKLLMEDGVLTGVIVNGKAIQTSNVILAMGGQSYPATGSTGDGYNVAKTAGHTIIPARPSLVPLVTEGVTAQELQGLTLKNVVATIWVNEKKVSEAFGELIFTHFGLSGPVILTLSRLVTDPANKDKNIEISLDLKPALDEQKLDNRLLRDLDTHGKKNLRNIFKLWLPAKLIPVFLEKLNLDPEKEGHQVTGKERKQIKLLMKRFPFRIKGPRSFKEAIITAGGVSTNEIKADTMESKIVKGLFFAGEIIDLDGETGGYNLQIAWSTGWVAGKSVG